MSPIVVVTGASGVGKTTLVRGLEQQYAGKVRCHYFDSIGVPTLDQMTAEFGSGEAWQEAMTHRWIERLAAEEDDAGPTVLDGQVRPSVVRAAFARFQVTEGRIILVDCRREVRERRLRNERHAPELASQAMANWAAYLRGQADALGIPVVETSDLTIAQAAAQLWDTITTGGAEGGPD